MRARNLILAASLFLALVLLRSPLEARPVTHMLVLMPGLAVAGAYFASWVGAAERIRLSEATANALSLGAVSVIFVWMLPRYIDASLISWKFELLKYVSIPLLIGGVLAVSWRRTNPYLRGFLQANALSMLGVLAYLYTFAPVRICNSYLVSAQKEAGLGFLWAALLLAVFWSWPLFFPRGAAAAAQANRLSAPLSSGKDYLDAH